MKSIIQKTVKEVLIFSRAASILTQEQLNQAAKKIDGITKPGTQKKLERPIEKQQTRKEYPRVLGENGTFYFDKKKTDDDLEKARNSPYY